MSSKCRTVFLASLFPSEHPEIDELHTPVAGGFRVGAWDQESLADTDDGLGARPELAQARNDPLLRYLPGEGTADVLTERTGIVLPSALHR